MNRLVPLLALNIGNLIWLIVVIVFIVLPAIGQLLAKAGHQQRPGGGPRPLRPPGGGAPARRPPAGGLEDEIGEFLRRAAQQRRAQAAPPPRPGPPPAPASATGPQVVEAEVVPTPALGEGIKRHVGQYLDAGEFRQRAAQLGGEVAQADQQVEQRLHSRFDHELSLLAATPGESAQAPAAEQPIDRLGPAAALPPTAAAGLAAMLGSSEGIRQAIVINEILTRPEDRWT
jgi:hypothetical protein